MSPRRAIPEKKQKGGFPTWMIVAAVAVIAVFVVIVGADFVAKSQGPAVVPTVPGIASSGRTEGDPKAPVAFLEFSDFQ